jgi:hypothetical protein
MYVNTVYCILVAETLPLIINNSHNNTQFDPIYEDITSLFPELST